MFNRMTFKSTLRKRLQKSPFAVLAFARVYSLALGIQARAVLLFRFRYAYIASDAHLIGILRIRLGKNVVIGSRSWLNVNDRSSKLPALTIGNNSLIGVRNFFTVGRTITLQDYCLTAMGCSFIGSAHRYDDPMKAYALTGTTPDADIYIGTNCFFGVGTQVIGNVRIGHGCVFGAGAVVRSDIPPFSLVVGNPARVIKRFHFGRNEWVAWPCDDLQEGPPEADYLEHLKQKHGFVFQPISAVTAGLGDIL
jgi:acetyltransferase-like isoleucine patch superfamily enzyme